MGVEAVFGHGTAYRNEQARGHGGLTHKITDVIPYIRNCHAKDILLADKLTVHLDEVRPGLGGLDYAVFLREVNRLDPDTPVMLEHLPNADEYRLAAIWVRAQAEKEGITC